MTYDRYWGADMGWATELWDLIWDAPRRKIDMQVLWPACKRAAETHDKDLDHARFAFMYHVANDPAWRSRYSEEELAKIVSEMK